MKGDQLQIKTNTPVIADAAEGAWALFAAQPDGAALGHVRPSFCTWFIGIVLNWFLMFLQ